MLSTAVRRFFIVCVFAPACGGTGLEPTIDASARLTGIDPPIGTTLGKGNAFNVSFLVQWSHSAPSYMLTAVAFVRDDGLYSPPLGCDGFGRSSSGASGLGAAASGIHRVNAVLLFKSLPAAPREPGCAPLG